MAGRIRTGSGCSSRGHVGTRAAVGIGRVEQLLHSSILATARTYTRQVPEAELLERRTTELLQRLIRFNTVNPPGNEQAAQEYLKELLEGAGFECELLARGGGPARTSWRA